VRLTSMCLLEASFTCSVVWLALFAGSMLPNFQCTIFVDGGSTMTPARSAGRRLGMLCFKVPRGGCSWLRACQRIAHELQVQLRTSCRELCR
jgi:hypothetical protein